MIILNETKIKYEHLDNILQEKINNIKFGNDVNIVIDLKEIYRKFFRPNILSDGQNSRAIVEEISSDIIGVIAHYRNYFFKKGKYTSFYFLYSESESDIMKTKLESYRREYYDKYLHGSEYPEKAEIIKKVTKALRMVIDKIPNCKYIDTSKFDEFTVARFLVEKTKGNEMNLILSNDEFMAQLVNDSTFMLNIKGIKTELIDKKNALKVFIKKDTTLSTNLLTLILAISSSDRYDLPNIKGMGFVKAVKVVEKLVESEKILDTKYIDFPLTEDIVDNKLIKENIELIKKNYSMILNSDILYSNNFEIGLLFNKPENIYNWNYFLEMNSKVFVNYPLNIQMLLKGESIK
jgi:hypothetical protein